MHEDLVSLPSGIIINLANVAFIKVAAGAKLRVVFVATYSIRDASRPMMVELEPDDSKALLDELKGREVPTSRIREKMTSKSGSAVNLDVLEQSPAKRTQDE